MREWIGWCATNILWRESMACTLTERADRRALRARKSLKVIFPLLFSALGCWSQFRALLRWWSSRWCWRRLSRFSTYNKKNFKHNRHESMQHRRDKDEEKKVNSRVRVSMAQGKDDEAEKSGSSWSYINSNVLVFAWDFFHFCDAHHAAAAYFFFEC